MQRKQELARFWAPFAFVLVCFIFYRVSLDTSGPAEELFVLNSGSDSGRMQSRVKLSLLVAQAIRTGKPVVALESTVVTHGG